MRRDAHKVTLEIGDQGHGFSARGHADASGPAVPGVGIQGMRERARQLGGDFEIHSSEGGTIVRAAIPVPAVEINPSGEATPAST